MVIWVCNTMSTLTSTQIRSTSRRQPIPSRPLEALVRALWVHLRRPQLTASRGFWRVRVTSVLNIRARSTVTAARMISRHPKLTRWLPSLQLMLMDRPRLGYPEVGIKHRLWRYLWYAASIKGFYYSLHRYRIRLAMEYQLWLLMVLNLSLRGNLWQRRSEIVTLTATTTTIQYSMLLATTMSSTMIPTKRKRKFFAKYSLKSAHVKMKKEISINSRSIIHQV